VPSILTNPSHVFGSGGVYDVRLIVADASGCRDTATRQVFTGSMANQAGFPTSATMPCTGDTVCFANTSVIADSGMVRWRWDFGDSAVSHARQPCHIYRQPGVYDVSLILTVNGCSDTLIKSNYITVTGPIADFTYGASCGAPHAYQFTNLSTGGHLSVWHFGDGTTDTAAAPVHTYGTCGTYFVTLQVWDTLSGCRNGKTRFLEVVAPEADFGSSTPAGCTPLPVNFYDSSSCASGITGWQWHFGNGVVSHQQHPAHTYGVPGVYDVMLVIEFGLGCYDTLLKPGLVQVGGPAGAIIPDKTQGCAPLEVCFQFTVDTTNTCSFAPGDGSFFSISDTVCYTYNQPGQYFPSMFCADPTGCVAQITGDTIRVDSFSGSVSGILAMGPPTLR